MGEDIDNFTTVFEANDRADEGRRS